jgi:SAM-dependent methyltransferase
MPDNHFDEPVATGYDDASEAMFDPAVLEPTVDFLAGLAGDGAALELGIGTGRVALPLAERGVPVHGIDLSAAMVRRLRAKRGAADVGVTIGDFATTRVPGTFRLAYLVFNTIMNLTTQDAQVECFRNVATHLEPGGCFVIEVGVPDLRRLPPGETVRAFTVTPDYVGFDEYTDLVNQTMYSHHYRVAGDKLDVFSVPFRYVWPSELDLMARLAGMTLGERWSDWKRQPFTAESTSHISVWQKPL